MEDRRRRESRARVITAIGAVGLLCLVAGIKLYANHREAVPAGEPSNPSYATAAELATTTRDVCKRLMECGGRGSDQLDDCIALQTRPATTDVARDVLVTANRRVLASCGALPCAQFSDCYLTALQQVGGAPAPAHPIAADTAAHFKQLVCRVVAENAGKIPDLGAPNPTPAVTDLNAMIDQLDDVGAVGELMKQVLATGC